MTAPDFVVHYDAVRPNGTTCTQILQRDHDGDYVTYLTLDRYQVSKAREITRGLNELERSRRKVRRDRARRRRLAQT